MCKLHGACEREAASRVHAQSEHGTCVVPTHQLHACRQAPVSCSLSLHTLVHILDISSSTHGVSSVLSIFISCCCPHFAFECVFFKYLKALILSSYPG